MKDASSADSDDDAMVEVVEDSSKANENCWIATKPTAEINLKRGCPDQTTRRFASEIFEQ